MPDLTPTPAYTGLLRALEPTDYAVPALWNDLHQVLLDQDAWLRERILATQDGSEIQAGVITDVHLGSRTVTDSNVPASDSNTLTALVSNLANRIKAVTGAAGWRDAPATTLAAAKAHADATTGVHGATSIATPSTIIIRDAAGRAQVAAPVADDDIARKVDVDNAASGIVSSHIGAGGDAHALVTTTVHGFMSSTDKVKLNAYPTTVTNAATANAAMKRDASGRAKVAAPSAQDDIARKLEVDTVAASLASHLHDTRYVRFDTAAQGLTTTQKGNARTNIGAVDGNHTHHTLYVRHDTAAQGLTSTEQGNARTNIDASASGHNHDSVYVKHNTSQALTALQRSNALGNLGTYAGMIRGDGAAGSTLPTGWSVVRNALGHYILTHNLGTTNYIVVASSSLSSFATIHTGSPNSNSINIYARNAAGAAADSWIHFTLVRFN